MRLLLSKLAHNGSLRSISEPLGKLSSLISMNMFIYRLKQINYPLQECQSFRQSISLIQSGVYPSTLASPSCQQACQYVTNFPFILNLPSATFFRQSQLTFFLQTLLFFLSKYRNSFNLLFQKLRPFICLLNVCQMPFVRIEMISQIVFDSFCKPIMDYQKQNFSYSHKYFDKAYLTEFTFYSQVDIQFSVPMAFNLLTKSFLGLAACHSGHLNQQIETSKELLSCFQFSIYCPSYSLCQSISSKLWESQFQQSDSYELQRSQRSQESFYQIIPSNSFSTIYQLEGSLGLPFRSLLPFVQRKFPSRLKLQRSSTLSYLKGSGLFLPNMGVMAKFILASRIGLIS